MEPGLKDSFFGRAQVVSGSAALLSLDRVLLSPEIALRDFHVGPRINSDRHPLIVELAIRPPRP